MTEMGVIGGGVKMYKIIFIFFFLISNNSFSMDLILETEIMMLKDKLMELEDREFLRNQNRNYIQPSTDSNLKKIGRSSDKKITYYIFRDTIKKHSSGNGIFFVELNESNSPRFDGNITYFYSQIGYQIDCSTREIRERSMRFFDSYELPIILNKNGKTSSEIYSKRFEKPFSKINPKLTNDLYSIYFKYICN